MDPAAILVPSALLALRLESFRCISAAELEFSERLNVFTGDNGSGKTSLLEAIFFLGRGRSFRATDNRVLIQSGTLAAQVFGRVRKSAGVANLGVGISPNGLEIHADSRSGATAAELAETLPIQAIHAAVGEMIEGPPELRRRYLDWGLFHVEHDYLSQWRQFRRALLQRNAVLREGGSDELLAAWETELATAGGAVDTARQRYLALLNPVFLKTGHDLLGYPVGIRYQRGWEEGKSLAAVLALSRESDRAAGYTRAGPQRGDLSFELREEKSRWRASKGQQKLLAASLILAQAALVAELTGDPGVLVIDEPAADLDQSRLGALMEALSRSAAQLFVASITADALALSSPGKMFHVEHGQPKALL